MAPTRGKLAGIVAAMFGELWELLQQVASGQDPDAATGTLQDAVCAITGTVRLPATPSATTLTLTGTPTTTIASGSQAKAASTGSVWATTADATIATLPAWTISTTYAAGARVTNAGSAYVCTVGGTSAGSGGPSDQSNPVATDGTVTWFLLGETSPPSATGTGAVDAAAACTVTGPTVAVATDISQIITPVGGWVGVNNLTDAVPGRNVESDSALRIRREEELAAAGASTSANIRALLLEVSGVTSAHVFVNNTDATDGDGVPPHAIEALVVGGADQDIINLLGSEVAAGIVTHGTSSGTYTDSEGVSETVSFTRPAAIDIYVDITLTYDATTYGGDALVKSAIAAYGFTQNVGDDAVAARIGASIFPALVNGALARGVAGVLDVPRSGSLGGTLISTTVSPTSDATIVITSRQIASYDTSRVAVHSTPGTP